MTKDSKNDAPNSTYEVEDGKIDRHGEMTGAITVNMVFTMVPVIIWSFFIGPAIFGYRVLPTLLIALTLALVLPFIGLKPSRRIWAILSRWADRLG